MHLKIKAYAGCIFNADSSSGGALTYGVEYFLFFIVALLLKKNSKHIVIYLTYANYYSKIILVIW